MGVYRKLIAAIVGMFAMVVLQLTGTDMTDDLPILEEALIAILTAFGVWGLRNDEPQAPQPGN